MKARQKYHKRWLRILIIAFFLLILAFIIYKLFFYIPPQRIAAASISGQGRETDGNKTQNCQVCYLLNLDGMKGLGHSALLLIDETGAGQIFSYNGMQYNLFQCLLGKKGIGKMKVISMNPEETSLFLETGEPPASAVPGEGFDECHNFDRILYRYITADELETILSGTQKYIEAGNEFEKLYADLYSAENEEGRKSSAEQAMEAFLARESLPKYHIYTHNCDTAARELIALADSEMAVFNSSESVLLPSSNYRNMCRFLGSSWGFRVLGEDSWRERLLQ